METIDILENDWDRLLTFFPPEEELRLTARETGAFLRRRGIKSPEDLLHLCLTYALGGKSLAGTAVWAEESETGSLSDVAVLKRIRGAADWLGCLLSRMLAEAGVEATRAAKGWRVRLIDATCVSSPGNKGTDQRIHLSWDLGTGRIVHAELTDYKGGETLCRFAVVKGEIAIADRGYAHRRGLASIAQAGGAYIVRLNWQNMPLRLPDGLPLDLFAALRGLPATGAGDFSVVVPSDGKTPELTARVVALRKSELTAEEARTRIRKTAAKKGRQVDERTLEAAGYIFVLTSLTAEEARADQVLELYRLRWQVELAFKRLKSILCLDQMAAKDPDLVRAFIFAKLIGGLLLDRFSQAYLAFSPWGYRLRAATGMPVEASPGVPDLDPLRAARGQQPGPLAAAEPEDGASLPPATAPARQPVGKGATRARPRLQDSMPCA